MDTHRINGIKFNFDRLTDDELENIHGHALERHRQATDEVLLIEETLFTRHHPEELGRAALQLTFDVDPQ